MNRQYCSDGLQFDDHEILNEKVYPIAIIDHQSIIANWNQNLLSREQALLRQLVDQTGFVCALEETRSYRRVDLHRCADDQMADFVLVHGQRLCGNRGALCAKASFHARAP